MLNRNLFSIFIGVLVGFSGNAFCYTDGALFRQNFESLESKALDVEAHGWQIEDTFLLPYSTNGIEGKIMQVRYLPNSIGTPRVFKSFKLNEVVDEATLSFDVKFHSNFEFSRGGKLHGLAGGSATTGCKPIVDDGWSVRIMWREDGEPELYIYHQNRLASCGDRFPIYSDFRFAVATWYRIDLYVKMNSAVASADGQAELYIDGEFQTEALNINFSGDGLTAIDRFMFNTFYGGADESWSPSQSTYSYFDNFTVHRGKKISGEKAKKCEIFNEGVYHSFLESCCADFCGACGGVGCSGLAGGAEQCCVSKVSANGLSCFQEGVSAPCNF